MVCRASLFKNTDSIRVCINKGGIQLNWRGQMRQYKFDFVLTCPKFTINIKCTSRLEKAGSHRSSQTNLKSVLTPNSQERGRDRGSPDAACRRAMQRSEKKSARLPRFRVKCPVAPLPRPLSRLAVQLDRELHRQVSSSMIPATASGVQIKVTSGGERGRRRLCRFAL